MTRSELILRLAQRLEARRRPLPQRDVERIVTVLFDTISTCMTDGGRVELRGFGAFSVKHREARAGRNPRTGESVDVEAKFIPSFKPSPTMRARLIKPLPGEATAAQTEEPADGSAAPDGKAAS